MATNSIYNSIKVTDKNFCRSLINALEETSTKMNNAANYSKPVRKMSKEDIEKVFKDR